MLSPNEELTLRRIALGIANDAELPPRALEHLRLIGLVDDSNRLTADGAERYKALPRPWKASTRSEQRLVSLLAAMKDRGKL
jgi:hypothetical protein